MNVCCELRHGLLQLGLGVITIGPYHATGSLSGARYQQEAIPDRPPAL
jgi:hypothetical protein